MDERSQVVAATVLGAVAGGVLGFLYLTEKGRSVRVRVEPFLEALIDELQHAQTALEKARDAANEGRREMDDVIRTSA